MNKKNLIWGIIIIAVIVAGVWFVQYSNSNEVTVSPPQDESDLIKQAAMAEWDIKDSSNVLISKLTDNHAKGNVGGTGTGGGFYFLAVKDNGNWIFPHAGQDYGLCGEIDSYNFPAEIQADCYDPILGKPRLAKNTSE